MSQRIRVLVVDDSALMRNLIGSILSSESDIEVVGFARNGRQAVEMTLDLKPDVVTLDVEMPDLNGLEALERIMHERPTPVIMLSSLTKAGADATIRCLQLGAIDFIQKPAHTSCQAIEQLSDDLLLHV